jgi:enoyl-CoA hydratase
MSRPVGWDVNQEEAFINMSELIQTQKQEMGVVIVTINRPEALNALNRAVLQGLKKTLEQLAADSSVRVVVLRGEGDKAFVAGADIVEMKDLERTQAIEFSRLGHDVCYLLEHMPKVTIAAVHGFALGGGTELALACDFILASEKAQFGLPEVGLGVIPGFGGTIRLARAIGTAKAKELIFSGHRFKAEEAKSLGLVRQVYLQADFFTEVIQLAKKIAGNSLGAVISAKKLMNEFEEMIGVHPKIDAETHQFGGLFGTFDQKEGMIAFTEKRAAKFKGL